MNFYVVSLVNGESGSEILGTTTDSLDDAESVAIDFLSEYLIEGDTIKKIKRDSDFSSDLDIEQIYTIQHYDFTYHFMEVRVLKRNHNKNLYS
jgi:hypothetical protein